MGNKNDREKDGFERLEKRLKELKGLLDNSGLSFDIYKSQADELLNKLKERRLVISVLGQFKRGKSSLINAIIGEEILPVSVLPLTSIPVSISHGRKISVELEIAGKKISFFSRPKIKSALYNFTTEEKNPKNRKKVSRINLFYPSDFLKEDILLVDTPGVGSIYRHNTTSAEAAIPRSDIGMFVVSPDPPYTETEMRYFSNALPKISDVFFVINKIDTVAGKDVKKISKFYTEMIKKIEGNHKKSKIFRVSSKKALNKRTIKSSGLPVLKKAVLAYLSTQKSKIIVNTVSLKFKNLVSAITSEVNLILNAIKQPLSQFEENIKLFKEKLSSIEEAAKAQWDTLALKQNRILQDLDDELEKVKMDAFVKFHESFLLLSSAGKIDINAIGGEIDRIASFFGEKYEVLFNFVREKAEKILLDSKVDFEAPLKLVKSAANKIFKTDFSIPAEAIRFEMERKPYWIDNSSDLSYKLTQDNIILRFLPNEFKRKIVHSKLDNDFQEIIMRNAGNIRWSMVQNLQNTFIKYHDYYNERFEKAKIGILNAIESVKNLKSDRENKSRNKIRQIGKLHSKLNAILKGIK